MNLNKILEKDNYYQLNDIERGYIYDLCKNHTGTEEELKDIINFLYKDISHTFHLGLISIIEESVFTPEGVRLVLKAHDYLRTLTKPS